MALYDEKGVEELKGKLEGFFLSYEKQTGSQITPSELYSMILKLYVDKKHTVFMQTFGTERAVNLKTIIEHYDELLPENLKSSYIVPRGTDGQKEGTSTYEYVKEAYDKALAHSGRSPLSPPLVPIESAWKESKLTDLLYENPLVKDLDKSMDAIPGGQEETGKAKRRHKAK